MATYQGYTGKQKFGLSSGAVTAFAKAKQEEMDKQKQQELERVLEEQQKQQNQKDGKNADGTKKDILQKVGDFGKGALSFGKDVGKGLVENYKRLGEGYGNVLGEVTGVNQQQRDLQTATQEQDAKTIAELGKKMQAASDPADKERYRQAIQKISAAGDTQDQAFQADQQRIIEQNDPVKGAAAVAGVGLDVLTAGVGGQAVKEGVAATKAGAKIISKETAKRVAANAGVGSGIGAVYGADAAVEEKGADVTAGDIIKQAGAGAAIGAVTPVAVDAAGKVISKAVKGLNANRTAGVAEDVAKGAEQKAIGAGYRNSDEVQADIQRVQNGEFTPEDDVWKTGKEGQELDNTKVKERFSALKDELDTSSQYENSLKQAGIDDAPRRSVDEIDAEASDLNGGKYSEDYYDAPKNVSSAEEVALHENLPEPLKQAGNLLATDKAYAQNQLQDLLTRDKADDVLKGLDAQYQADLDSLAELPEARAAQLKEQYTNDYLDQVDEIEGAVKADAPEAEKHQKTLEAIQEQEKQLVSDVNGFQADYFDDFKTLSQERVNTRLGELEAERGQANSSLRAKTTISEAADNGKFEEVAQSSPENINAVRDEVDDNFDSYRQSHPVVQALNRIMSPSKVFEAMGLRDLHTKIFQASGKMIKANNEDLKTIRDISKSIDGNKDLANSIVDYIEGNTDTIATGNKELADKIKSFFDVKGEALKKMGYATREDYFPHIFDKDDKVVQRVFGSKATGTVNFGNLKERTTEGGDYSRDVIAVMSKYAQGFNKKAYLEPALKPLESLRTQAELTNSEARFVNDYLNQLQNKNRSGVEEGINNAIDSLYGKESKSYGENHFRKALGAQRMVSAVATMGGNLSTIVRNMTQSVNTAATLNPKWATAGFMDALRTLPNKKSELFKELQDSGVFEGGVSKNYNLDMDSLGIGSKAAEGAKKGVDLLMSGIRASDVLLRSQAYLGARAKHLAKNAGDIEGAKKAATEAVIDTQFVTSNIDNAVALNGPMVRSLTQLATFSAKQAEYLGKMGVDIVKKGPDGYGFANAEAAGRALTFVMGAGASVAVLGPVIGMKPQEFIPFYDQFTEGSLYRSPLVSILFGDGKNRQGLTSTVAQTFDPSKRDSEDEGVDEVWKKFWDGNWSQLVPAGSQIKKTSEGLKTYESGQSQNASGKTRFLQDDGTGTGLQSILFGQYATKAGQDWVNSGMNTLSDKQTQQLQGLSPDKQKQYYDYYQSAKNVTGRDDAVSAIKEAAKSGNLNEATRLSREFNDKVTKAMSTYWDDNTELPARLKDDMTSTLYIDVQKTVDTLDRKKSQKTIQKENAYTEDDQED